MTIPAHAELIHAYADGKTLQFFDRGTWIDWKHPYCPNTVHYEVRIKPDEPKVTRYLAYEDSNRELRFLNAEATTKYERWKRIPRLDKEVTDES